MARPSESSVDAVNRRAALADAIAHPVQVKILSVLYERPDVTIRQIAARLEEPPRRIRHQIAALVAAGLVEVTGEEFRRGVVERRYATSGPNEIVDQGFLSDDQRVRVATAVVRLLVADVAAAARAGTLGEGSGRCEARFYGEVDEAGLQELAEIHLRAYREIGEALEAGRKRQRESGRPGTEIVSALFFFEVPLWASTGVAVEPDAE